MVRARSGCCGRCRSPPKLSFFFFFVGRPLLDRIGPARAAMLAAAAGIMRWGVMAETASIPALAAIQPLHGLTFALLHLTCMRLLAQCVPGHLEATALTVYGTVGIGAPTAVLILVSGRLYSHFGAYGFWVMTALCVAALPFARRLCGRANCQPRRSYEGC